MIELDEKIHQKTAFTLAEVLITLGIIGIVAAITMPILLNNVQNSKLPTEKKKKISMYLVSSADKVSLDTQGRLLVGDRLKDKVSLAGEKEAVVFGNINHIEIWNKAKFEEQVASISKEEVIDIMDELNGIGI